MRLELIRVGMFPLTRLKLIDLNWPWGVPSHILPRAYQTSLAIESGAGVFPLTFSLTRLELTDLGSVLSHLIPLVDQPESVTGMEYFSHIRSQETGFD